jgi:hypothetical protein
MATKSPPLSTALVGTALGLALGTVYSLSPMTVIVFAGIGALLLWTARALPPEERRWVVGVVGLAILLRIVTVAGVFMAADHDKIPYFSMFGDEAQTRTRSLWLRNIAWGIPIDPVYFKSAFNSYGFSGFAYVGAALQLLVGEAPYGLQLLNILVYLTTALLLHRVTRTEYGRVPAFAVLAILLFVPSLFIWSVSALKEPTYYLLNALVVVCTIRMIRATSWRTRGLAGAAAILLLWPAAMMRGGGFVAPAASLVAGAVAWTLVRRPRLFALAALALLVAAAPASTRDRARRYAVEYIRPAAQYHRGSATSPGHGYRLLDESFYHHVNFSQRLEIDEDQAARFLFRALVGFFTIPWPWQATSLTEAVYVPQQMLWYVLVMLAIIGLGVGLRRHIVFTAVIASNVIAGTLLLSVTNGNIGTLVRIRDMLTPMIIVLAGLGGCAVARWVTRPAPGAVSAVPPFMEADSAADRAPAPAVTPPRFPAARRAWIDSRARALLSTSLIGRLAGFSVRGVAAVVIFLFKGRVPEGAPLDYSGLVAVARRQWLVRNIQRLAPRLRKAWDASHAGRMLAAARIGDDADGLARRVSLIGWTAVIGAGTYALLQRFTTTPAPLGPEIAALAAGLGLICMLAARSLSRAWLYRRTLA